MRLVAFLVALAIIIAAAGVAVALRYETAVLGGRVVLRIDRWSGCSQLLWPEPENWTCPKSKSGLDTGPQASDPYLVVEGERFGNLSLGMSVDQVMARLALPISSASDENGTLRYNWNDDDGSWSVWFDKNTKKAVFIFFFPKFTFDQAQERRYRDAVKFTTTQGARYGHSGETIKTLYGKPSRVVDRESNLGYWYRDIRTEFLMVCDGDYKPMSKCPEWARKVDQIRIYANGWEP